MSSLRLPALCVALVSVVGGLSACGGSGDSIPGNAVAVVDGQPITTASFNRWLAITAKSTTATNPSAVVPDPPSFTNCVAALRKQSEPAKGQPKPTDASLLAQCKAQEQQLRQQVVTTLIQTEWIDAEAKQQNVSVPAAAVQQQVNTIKKQSFPKAGAYEKFLQQSGMTAADVSRTERTQLLGQAIVQKVQKSTGKVSAAQISSYYDKNRAQFQLPERRDLDVILTKSQAQANAAKAAVQGGMSWKAAAKRFSTDAASKANGGLLRGVAKGQEDKALDRVAFSARKGAILGPVKGQFGWYVVRVVAITPPKTTTLAQATPQIRTLLSQQSAQQRAAKFTSDFQKRWKAKTSCRAGYVVALLCKNAPAPKPALQGTTTG
jgi:foldase protein PrsA